MPQSRDFSRSTCRTIVAGSSYDASFIPCKPIENAAAFRSALDDCDRPCEQRRESRCDKPCAEAFRSALDDCDHPREQHNDPRREQPCQERRRCCDREPAMVYAVMQELAQLYDLEAALARGTLFPCLDKPMNGCGCTSPACPTRHQQLAFALWELRLYLNTHPCDEEALQCFRKLCAAIGEDSYAHSFLGDCTRRWSWTDDPWPWEYDACCNEKEGKSHVRV